MYKPYYSVGVGQNVACKKKKKKKKLNKQRNIMIAIILKLEVNFIGKLI